LTAQREEIIPMNSIKWTVALLVLSACGCSVDPTESESLGQVAEPLAGQAYYYLTCNATGWQLNDDTRMEDGDPLGIDKVIEFDVTEPWMVSGNDNCAIVATDEYNGWGTEQYRYSTFVDGDPAVLNHVDAPKSGRYITSDQQFTVNYPKLGRFRFSLYRARAAFSINAVE
jgi:hypothetical protein